MKQESPMLVARLGLCPDCLRGETIIVTDTGGGIGYEAARAQLWLGANVVIAEINTHTTERELSYCLSRN
jgi:alanine dehydrogenase